MPRILLFFVAFGSIIVVRAQQSFLSGPVEGYVFDAPTGSIRAVIGSLGSASLGPPVLQPLDFASLAPHQNYAIASRSGQSLFVSGLESEPVSTTVLPDSVSTPEGLVWSEDGSVAVLYSQTGNWIQTLTGLPNSVTAGPVVSLVPLGGSLSAVATDAHGARVAIGVTGGLAGVYEIVGGQNLVPLLDSSVPIALGFADDGTLYALDSATKQVFEVGVSVTGSVNSATQTWPEGLEDAIAIQPARDASNRQVLYVAGRSDRLLLTYDGSSHQSIASVPLSFEPTTIQPFGSNSFLLRFRSNTSDPLWTFTSSPQLMVYFVPATPLPNFREPRRRAGGQ
jgi:hypothetical protein